MNGNAVHFNMIVDFDDETAFAVNLQSIDQIRTFRIHLYDNIGGLYLEGADVCHIVHKERGIFSGGCIIELIEISQLFFTDAALFKQVLYLMLVKS